MFESILSSIDIQITKLQQARALLAGASAASVPVHAPRRGRPKGSKNAVKAAPPAEAKRTMSEEGKARIAAAQKKRWAAQKKAAKNAICE